MNSVKIIELWESIDNDLISSSKYYMDDKISISRIIYKLLLDQAKRNKRFIKNFNFFADRYISLESFCKELTLVVTMSSRVSGMNITKYEYSELNIEFNLFTDEFMNVYLIFLDDDKNIILDSRCIYREYFNAILNMIDKIDPISLDIPDKIKDNTEYSLLDKIVKSILRDVGFMNRMFIRKHGYQYEYRDHVLVQQALMTNLIQDSGDIAFIDHKIDKIFLSKERNINHLIVRYENPEFKSGIIKF